MSGNENATRTTKQTKCYENPRSIYRKYQAHFLTHRLGGIAIITWNSKAERLEFYYFTTAGYSTHGTIAFEEGKIITHEDVTGNESDVTAVKAITEILSNGRMHAKSRCLKKGAWVDGHEVIYEEAPGAQVVFK